MRPGTHMKSLSNYVPLGENNVTGECIHQVVSQKRRQACHPAPSPRRPLSKHGDPSGQLVPCTH